MTIQEYVQEILRDMVDMLPQSAQPDSYPAVSFDIGLTVVYLDGHETIMVDSNSLNRIHFTLQITKRPTL